VFGRERERGGVRTTRSKDYFRKELHPDTRHITHAIVYEKDAGPIVEPAAMDLNEMPFASALLSQTLRKSMKISFSY